MAAFASSLPSCSLAFLPVLLLLAALLQPALGEPLPLLRGLRAGVAASAAAKGAKAAPAGGPRLVVKLRRASLRPAPGSLAAGLSEDTGFYVGSVAVGSGPEPQLFSVLFDTASGHVVLPSAKCQNVTCLERHRYSPAASPKARLINVDGTPVQHGKLKDFLNIGFSQIDVGDGDVWGDAVHDVVCLGGPSAGERACPELGLVAATSMDDVPFRALPYDGMVGLGLDSLMFASPLFSVLRQLAAGSAGMLPQFSLSFRGTVGELSFGGPGPDVAHGLPPEWFPVVRPEEGYWQVRIEAVHVDNHTIETCAGGCRGIVDSGASRLGVPASLAPALRLALASGPVAGGGCQGPDLHLQLSGGALLTLKAQDYAGPSCSMPQFAPLNLDPAEVYAGVFVLGESVLRRYDTIFDWGSKHIGFSLAMPRAVRIGPPVPGVASKGTSPMSEAGNFIDVVQV